MTSRKKLADRPRLLVPLMIIGALFFIFGFVTWLNGILIPYLQIACELTNFQAVFVAFSFYISYTLMALPSSRILERTGFKSGIMIGLLIMAAGTALFIPAAMGRTYALFLSGLFVMGTGLALLQTAVNPYITILGKRETAAVRFSIMGICNNLAGAIGPLVLSYYILNDGDAIVEQLRSMNDSERAATLDALSKRVIGPYIVMTLVLLVLGYSVRYSALPEVDQEQEADAGIADAGRTSVFHFPYLVLGALALFFYVGVEVIAGNTIVSYGISLGVPIDAARVYTTLVMIAMLVGYVVGIAAIPRLITYHTALIVSAITGALFTLAAIFTPGNLMIRVPGLADEMPVTVGFIVLLGLSNALIWPAIWPLAIHNLGRFMKTGSALLIMAIAGGAILPLVWGFLSDRLSERAAYWILLPSYLFILYYALHGYRIRRWSRNAT